MNQEKYISTIKTTTGTTYTLSIADAIKNNLNIDDIIKRIEERFSSPKMKSISCLHCGAPLEMKFDDHIVNCNYCHSVYAIDLEMIRDLRS